MKRAGIRSNYFPMVEGFNTPLANRIYFEYALSGKAYETENHAIAVPSHAIENARFAVSNIAAFVFTVGLIYAPFLDGHFVFEFESADIERLEWRSTSVDHLVTIIELLVNANPDLQIVLTLSPIPIAGSFSSVSAVTADCLSKSILRASIGEVMNLKLPGVSYWPSFEAIRWLSGHMGQFFGTEGEDQRHLGQSCIQAIVDAFYQRLFQTLTELV